MANIAAHGPGNEVRRCFVEGHVVAGVLGLRHGAHLFSTRRQLRAKTGFEIGPGRGCRRVTHISERLVSMPSSTRQAQPFRIPAPHTNHCAAATPYTSQQ